MEYYKIEMKTTGYMCLENRKHSDAYNSIVWIIATCRHRAIMNDKRSALASALWNAFKVLDSTRISLQLGQPASRKNHRQSVKRNMALLFFNQPDFF